MRIAPIVLALVAANEARGAFTRFGARRRMFDLAARRAKLLNRPLIVIGDPDTGAHTRITRAYGCGDVCVDLTGCPLCPVGIVADITRGVPGIRSNSAVVYCSCVLEYVRDPQLAYREMLRMAGSPENIFLVTVQPWTITGTLFPGARWWIRRDRRTGAVVHHPIPFAAKAGVLSQVAALGVAALRGR